MSTRPARKTPVGLGLLAFAGCNQIFGLDPVGILDAGEPDAPFPRIPLTNQIATTKLVAPDILGQPDTIVLAPISPAPQVRVGPDTGALVDVVYDPDGGVEIPVPDHLSTRWRVEYTVPGGVPHEVSWAPQTGARLVVPVVGRVDRTPVPANSGYDVQPIQNGAAIPPAPGAFTGSHIFTFGTFADVSGGLAPHQAKLDATTTRTQGPLGMPVAGDPNGDFAVLVN